MLYIIVNKMFRSNDGEANQSLMCVVVLHTYDEITVWEMSWMFR